MRIKTWLADLAEGCKRIQVNNEFLVDYMKYASTLPTTAIFAVSLLSLLVHMSIIPPGLSLLEGMRDFFGEYFYLLIFLIIFLESIVYVGFYFPGQFFAVVLVILAKPDASDIVALTVAMVFAATLGSVVNYLLGKATTKAPENHSNLRLKHLLLAMIHMNSLAFFMYAQGANRRSIKVVGMAGLLNLPYYLALITLTAVMSEEIMQVAESTWLVLTILGIWLAVAIGIDLRKRRQKLKQQPATELS